MEVVLHKWQVSDQTSFSVVAHRKIDLRDNSWELFYPNFTINISYDQTELVIVQRIRASVWLNPLLRRVLGHREPVYYYLFFDSVGEVNDVGAKLLSVEVEGRRPEYVLYRVQLDLVA